MTEITHTVVVTTSEAALASLRGDLIGPLESEVLWDAHEWHVECSNPAACDGWEECLEPHEVDGVSAADGPYETVCGMNPCRIPWCGQDEYFFHGALHTWQSGNSCWSLPVKGCPVARFAEEVDDVPLDRPGRWVVDVDWGDWGPIITLAYPVEDPRHG